MYTNHLVYSKIQFSDMGLQKSELDTDRYTDRNNQKYLNITKGSVMKL